MYFCKSESLPAFMKQFWQTYLFWIISLMFLQGSFYFIFYNKGFSSTGIKANKP